VLLASGLTECAAFPAAQTGGAAAEAGLVLGREHPDSCRECSPRRAFGGVEATTAGVVVKFGGYGHGRTATAAPDTSWHGCVMMIAARSEELEEASSEQRESSDPGHGSYQNESSSDPHLDAVDVSPQLGVDALVVAVGAALSEVAHQS
jgi:hypothetical protein